MLLYCFEGVDGSKTLQSTSEYGESIVKIVIIYRFQWERKLPLLMALLREKHINRNWEVGTIMKIVSRRESHVEKHHAEGQRKGNVEH